jgi:hypothetical protein
MAKATTTPNRRPPSAVASAKSHSRGVNPRAPTGAPSVRLVALPAASGPPRKRACACSPTTHPGSFRCALHRGHVVVKRRLPATTTTSSEAPAPASSGLSTIRRLPAASPLARVAAVDGVRRALAGGLVRPSSRPRRRCAFRPRPSRLSVVSFSTAGDNDPSSRQGFQ